jgi:hypothetical protein
MEIIRSVFISRPKNMWGIVLFEFTMGAVKANPMSVKVNDKPKMSAYGPHRCRCQVLERKIGMMGKAQGFKSVNTPAK